MHVVQLVCIASFAPVSQSAASKSVPAIQPLFAQLDVSRATRETTAFEQQSFFEQSFNEIARRERKSFVRHISCAFFFI